MPESDHDSSIQRFFKLKDHSICGILLSPIVLGFTVVIYVLSKTANDLLFSYAIAVTTIIGILYFSNSHPPQQVFKQQTYISLWNDDDNQKLDQEDQYIKLDLFYPPLTRIVEQLLEFFYHDFVQSWWNPLQSGYDDEFDKTIKLRLNAAITSVEKTLLKQERNDIVMSIMYGLANTLIIHMRECRTFETSELPMEAYILENPQSPFAQLLPKKEQHHQLRGLSNTILKRILPVTDVNSRVVNSMLKELLATHLFGNILTICSDPDFINGWIVQYLSEPSTGISNKTDTDSSSSLNEVDGLRSLVEKATEDAMAAEQQQQQDHSQQSASDSLKTDSQQKQNTTINNGNKRDEISSDPNDTTSSNIALQQSSPSTPEPNRTYFYRNNTSSTTTGSPLSPIDDSKRRMTLSKADEAMLQYPMIYPYGTVSFSVMDISPSQDPTNVDKSRLMYIIQIERPAMQESSGSEGGGYVITRTYNDFDVFQQLMRAKHGKRVARLNLRLPLDTTRSWLRKKKPTIGGTSGGSVSITSMSNGINGTDGEGSISQGLEYYLDTVVGDAELGRDPVILAFLRKERATENGTTQTEHSFAEEYSDEVLAYTTSPSTSQPSDTNQSTLSMGIRAKSIFGRSSFSNGGGGSAAITSSSSSSSNSILSISTPTDEERPFDDVESTNKKRMNGNVTRENSISSMKSNSTTNQSQSEEDMEEDDKENRNHLLLRQPPIGNTERLQQKPLSAMDTELLIETTFALIVEIFDLTTANNKAWMRRSLLNVLREIVRRSYTELISKQYNDYIQAYLSPDALVGWMELIKDKFWPNGSYHSDTQQRTKEEKKQTEQQAKVLLVQRAIPGGVRQLIGDQNCTLSMERIWNRLQDEDLNRVLVLQVLERVIRPLFG
ncbi:PXA domain-containing protein [Halteromyces radiatus]|uniref:PXA domain-containing protein n=1 Tax=Halteromyces radiatus TaxID=101107 RepID=UPI00221F50E6|nr:PXA domain-containing protein [Halteromyces radiatus]KAI8093343.1 PXA domain-containing protein [Halteromyces radiatus]